MSHDCAEWRDDLGAYVIGALEEDERAAMRRHLAACPACRADYEDFLPVRDWLARARRHLEACRECRADYEDLLEPERRALSGAGLTARARPKARPGMRAADLPTIPFRDKGSRAGS